MKNQIKKLLSLALVVVMCLSTLALCVSAEEEKCEHANRVQTSTTEATCTGYGYTSYKCADCGADFVENLVLPLDHDWKVSKTDPATCMYEARKNYECSRCDATKQDELKPKKNGKDCDFGEDDDFVYELIEGVFMKVWTCSVCGAKKYAEGAANHSHAIGNNANMVPDDKTLVKPTCTDKGSIEYKCKVEGCGLKVTVAIDATHQYIKHAKVPETCTTDGVIEHYTCANCDKLFTYKSSKYTEITADKLPIPAAHEWDKENRVLVSDEDCVNNVFAVYNYTCKACGEKKNEAETELVHEYIKTGASFDATCVTYGLEAKVCALCGNTTSTLIDPIKFLVFVGENGKDTDETKEDDRDDVYLSLAELKLAANADKYKAEKVEIVCGGYAKYVYELQAKCSETGCDFCKTGKVTVEYGDKMEHTWEKASKLEAYKDWEAKAPTCTATGLYEAYYCTYCYENYKTADDQPLVVFDRWDGKAIAKETEGEFYTLAESMKIAYEIPTAGHKYGEAVYCSVEKIAMKVCSVCGNVRALTDKEKEAFVAPEGTSHITVVEIVAEATCTTAGEKVTYCYACHKEDAREVIPALGHKYASTPTETIPGTCQEATGYVYECLNGCKATKYVSGSLDKTAAGHKLAMGEKFASALEAAEVLRTPTCTIKGLYQMVCTECKVEFTYTGDYGHNVVELVEDAICALGKDGKKGTYCMTCYPYDATKGETPNAKGWVTYTVIEAVHDEKGTAAAQDPCGKEYGWDEYKYCKACETYQAAIRALDKAEGGDEDFLALQSKEAIMYKVRYAGHKYTEETYKGYDATCTVAGVASFKYCKVCEDVDAIVAKILKDKKEADGYKKPTGHMYNDKDGDGKKESGEDYTQETYGAQDCDSFQYTLRYCTSCGEFKALNFKDAKGHDWDIPKDAKDILSFNLDEKAATYDCTKDGYKYYVCKTSGCEEIFVLEETRVLAHHRDIHGKAFTSSCASIDEATKCVICKKTVEITHDFVEKTEDSKAPTCVEPGWTISICKDCGLFEDLNKDGKNDASDIVIVNPVNHHSVWYDKEAKTWKYQTYDKDGKLVKTESVATLEKALKDSKVKIVEEVDATYLADGKIVYVCAACGENATIVLNQLKGVSLDITYENAIVPGAVIVNGGLVKFTVALNANDIDAAALKAEFLYDASVLTLVEYNVAPIFDSENTKTSSEVGDKVITALGQKIGRVTVIADASANGLTATDVNLNGENIAFVTLTFRVAVTATELNGFTGLVTEVANAKEEMIVDLDVDAIFEAAKFYEQATKLTDKYADEIEALEDALLALELAEEALADAEEDLEEANADVEAAEAALEAAKAAYDAAKEAADKAAADLAGVADTLTGDDLAPYEKAAADAADALEAAEEALDEAEVALETAKAIAKAAQKAVTKAEGQVTVKEALLESAQGAYADYVEEYTAIMAAFAAWQEEMFGEDGSVADLTEELNANSTEVSFDIAILGDVNGNGKIDMADAVAIRKMQFTNMDGTVADGEFTVDSGEKDADKKPIMVECNYTAEADVDMDGDVDTVDYALLQQYLATKINYEELVLTSQN